MSANADNHPPEAISIAVRTLNSGRRLVAVEGELDLTSAGTLSEALERELGDGQRVLLDLSGVSFIDSTGLAAIINAANGHRGPAARFELSADLRSQARRLMELTGVLTLFPLVDGEID